VFFAKDKVAPTRADHYLILVAPVLPLERDIRFSECILKCNSATIGYLFKESFYNFLLRRKNLMNAINEYLKRYELPDVEFNSARLEIGNLSTIESTLLRSLIKVKRIGSRKVYYDGFISRNLNRRISLRISRYLAYTEVTPNQLTILSFSIAILGATLFLLGNYMYTLIGGLLVQISSILDGCCQTKVYGD